MRKDFYNSEVYRNKQSRLTKQNWKSGRMDFLRKSVTHYCTRNGCSNTFKTIPSDPKKYCSHQCSAMVSNSGRNLSNVTKIKIALALTGRTYPSQHKNIAKFGICLNARCQKKFLLRYWRPKHNPIKYCSRDCAIKDIGGRPTSPRAARAKAGVRKDISPTIYFYSRWEANFARLMNLLKIKWVHQPKTFQLKTQKYTPDFYLPKQNIYIEIKNFLSDYSKSRDEQFRQRHPTEKLILILKNDYLELESEYSQYIKKWEYSNSNFENAT